MSTILDQDINFIDPNSITPDYHSEMIDLNQSEMIYQNNPTVNIPNVEEIQPEANMEVIAPSEEVSTDVITETIKVEDKVENQTVKQSLPQNLDFEVENIEVNNTDVFNEVKTYTNERYELQNIIASMEIVDDNVIEMMYGNSDYMSKPTGVNDIFSELSSYKKLGKFIDVYLPTSNIAVRIYEFENDVIKENIMNDIVRDYDSSTRSTQHSPFNRQFMNRIFDNTIALTSDSERVTRTQLERLANKDMNLLVLAVATLLTEVGIETGRIIEVESGAPITITNICEKCGAQHDIKVHPRDLLKDQYTKEMITALTDNYSVNRTFDANLKESVLAKAYNIKLENNNTDNVTEIKLKEASYIKYITLEDRLNTYILNKWGSHDLFKSITSSNEYSMLTNKDKLTYLTEEALNTIDINNDAMKYLTDQVSANNLLRLDRITVVNKKTGIVGEDSTIVELLDKSEENTFNMIANLPQSLLERMKKAIDTMDSKSINSITHTWTCEKEECKNVNKHELNLKDFIVFMIAEVTKTTQ